MLGRFIRVGLRIVIGAMFIVSGVMKLYPIETFELTFVDLGISSWSVAPFVARLLICVEITLGVLIVVGVWQQKMVKAALVLLGLFSLYLGYLLISKGNNVNCGCFGEAIPMTPIESLFKNAFLAVMCVVLILLSKGITTAKWQKWVGGLLILLSIATPFILNPIKLSQNVHEAIEPFELDITGIPKHFIDGDSLALNEGEVVVAFLSVTCRHCKAVAYMLSIAQEKYNLPRVVTVFIGKEEKLPKFWEESNSEFPHVFFPNQRVFKITSGKFPTIMYMKDGMVLKHWTGNSFTYTEIEKLATESGQKHLTF